LPLTTYVDVEDLSDDEKDRYPFGKLESRTYKAAWADYWKTASNTDKQRFKRLPNFDAEIFEEITGINVEQDL
jgi:hypothetical protein